MILTIVMINFKILLAQWDNQISLVIFLLYNKHKQIHLIQSKLMTTKIRLNKIIIFKLKKIWITTI